MATEHQSKTRVKRKPPPVFPYSSRYPPPDSTDPFASLASLRERAQSSNVALVTPQEEIYPEGGRVTSPETTESGHSHYVLHADAQPSDHSHSTGQSHIAKAAEAKPTQNRPWYHLTTNRHAEAKPSRPPRSKTRPGRDSAFVSDGETQQDQARQRDLFQRYQHPKLASPFGEPQRRQTDTPVSKSNPEPHYHKRSRSGLPSLSTPAPDTVSHNVSSSLCADLSRQYTYDDRQSHGYMFDDDDLDFGQIQDHFQDHVDAPSKPPSRAQTRPSPGSNRSGHPTPAMTPDNTPSSMSTSPRGHVPARLNVSLSNRDLPPKPVAKTFVKSKPTNVTIVREPLSDVVPVQETPAIIPSSEFSLLLPPSQPAPPSDPPSPVRPSITITPPAVGRDTQRPHNTHAHASTRQAESEPENFAHEPEFKKKGVITVGSMRRRLRNASGGGSGVRGKPISSPSPLHSPGRKPSFASDSSLSVGHGKEGGGLSASLHPRGATVPPASGHGRSDSESGSKGPSRLFPKPKKSLSTVNLHLKPLPNLSMQGHPISPGADLSMASINVGGRSTRDDDPSGPSDQEIILPPARSTSLLFTPPRVVKRTARLTKKPATRSFFIARQESYESEFEDEPTFSAMIALRQLTSPASAPSVLGSRRERDIGYSISDTDAHSAEDIRPVRRYPPPPGSVKSDKAARRRSASPFRYEKDAGYRKSGPPNYSTAQSNTSLERLFAQPRSDSPVETDRSQRRAESPVYNKRPPIPRPHSQSSLDLSRMSVHSRSESPASIPSIPDVSHRRSMSPTHFVPRPPPSSKRSDSPTVQRQAVHRRPESPTHPKSVRSNSPVERPTERPSMPPRRPESPAHSQPPVHSGRAESPAHSRAGTKRRSDSPERPPLPPVQQRSASPVEPRRPAGSQYKSGPPSVTSERSAPATKRSNSPTFPPKQASGQRRPSDDRGESRRRAEQPAVAEEVMESPLEFIEPPGPLPLSPPVPYKDVTPGPMPLSPPPPRVRSPASRAKSPNPPELDSPPHSQPFRPPSPIPSQPFRPPSPPPPPLASTQQRPRASDERKTPKREGSKEDKAEYLPVALLRQQAQSSNVQQGSSGSTRRKPSVQASAHTTETVSVRSRARSPTVTSDSSHTVVAWTTESVRRPRHAQVVEETPATPAKDILVSPDAPRRHRTIPATPALTLASPPPIHRPHAYPPKKAESYSHSSRSKTSHRNQSRSPTDFEEGTLVSKEQLSRAASMIVVAQNGIRKQFGEIFQDRKTIVIFIRHFWCAMDQDYMYSIVKNVDPAALKRSGIQLVIIGNGSPGMIKSYRQIFRTSFEVYTDPSLRLHAALGMTKRTNDPGPEYDRPEYIRHGLVGGIAMVVRNALRVGMPVWEKGGETSQLGGEFVFGPGMTCSFAHRMRHTRGHILIHDVLGPAGVQAYASHQVDSQSTLGPDEEETWQEPDEDYPRAQATRERTKQSREVGWNEDDVVAPNSDSDSEAVSQSGSWELPSRRPPVSKATRVERAGSERTRPPVSRHHTAPRRTYKRLHVSNPDHEDDGYQTYPYSKQSRKNDSTTGLSRSGKYGRKDEAY